MYRFDVHVVTGDKDLCPVPGHHGCQLHSLHAPWPLDKLIVYVKLQIEGIEHPVAQTTAPA